MLDQISETKPVFRLGTRVPVQAMWLVLGGVIASVGGLALYLWYERGAAIMVDLTTFFCG